MVDARWSVDQMHVGDTHTHTHTHTTRKIEVRRDGKGVCEAASLVRDEHDRNACCHPRTMQMVFRFSHEEEIKRKGKERKGRLLANDRIARR